MGQQVEAIIDVKLGNTYENSYKYKPMAALLSPWETIKKDKHGKHCNNQRKHSSPFSLSSDGIIGREAQVVLVKLSHITAAKLDEPITHVQG